MDFFKWEKTKTVEKLLERAYFNGKKFVLKGRYIAQMNLGEESQMLIFSKLYFQFPEGIKRFTKIGECAVATAAEVNQLLGYQLLNEDF
jgi:hypothetical protein